MTLRTGLAIGLSLAALATGTAQAQTTTTAPDTTVAEQTPPADAAQDGVGDIVVTAQRREQRLQDVPLAVSVLTSQDLETRQITRTIDLFSYVPNMIAHNNTSVGTANSYSMRGLNNNETISTFDLPVGTYVDDVYMSRQSANNFQFFDVERIEVLRGPQGTLFGRNTTGGAINVILKKPANEFGGFVEGSYGKYDRVTMRGSVDVPIIKDKLLTKFQAYYVDDNGYVENRVTGQELNSEHSYGGRGAVRFLGEGVTWDITGDYNYQSYANFPNFYDPATKERVSYTRLREGQTVSQIFGGRSYLSSGLADNTLGNVAESWSATSNLEIEATDNLTVNLITGYRHIYNEYLTDSAMSLLSTSTVYTYPGDIVTPVAGSTSVLANDSWHGQFSQEIKFTGNAFDNKLTYVGGLYYIREDNKTSFANVSITAAGVGTLSADRTMWNNTDAIAGYFQGDYKLTDSLTATAGIRYTAEYKDIHFAPNASPLTPVGTNLPFTTLDVINAGNPVKQSAHVWTPRFALDWKLAPDVSVFASATKGFKSGGWVSRSYNAAGMFTFGKETIWSFEGGLRSQFFDRKVRFNLTGFYFNDFDNQLPAGRENPLVPGQIIYVTRNFADLRNYGVEAELTVAPVRGLNFSWTAGWQHARFKNIDPSVLAQAERCRAGVAVSTNCNQGIVTSSGQIALPSRVAPFNSTVNLSYTADLGKFQFIPSGSWAYTDGSYPSAQNDPRGYQEAHSLFNAGLTLRNRDMGWSLSAECTNCFNKRYVASFLIFPYLNEPGRWSLRARFDF
ncbi:TonB-dependent receptor [Sphingomonas sp. HITSZ_GF]|uniref:TonB-dependent receptor n=1 Tax=Sphingomonas sp. HITSZ_GF TaxID=3037247 RepID=UPI00240CF2B7|nr:TonB-dependent receptor [Sphingomonas sp. HITSZ_GF]MDG2532148.1 TonB-dependent receptor [Sphingomonas sp. HITSZ_GF]